MKAASRVVAVLWLGLAAPAFAAGLDRSAYVSECGASLQQQWLHGRTAHPFDPVKYVSVVQIDVPVGPKSETGYQLGVSELRRSFPSFKESPLSGLLAGCCAVPLYGSIDPSDFERLQHRKFRALCTIGSRLASHSVGVWLQDRGQYGESIQGKFYFAIRWRSPFWHPTVPLR